MKNTKLLIFLVLLVAAAFYFLGKMNGSNQTKTDIIQNTALIKQIAELSALEVNGSTNIKASNQGNNTGVWEKFKNYFAENTLQVTIPYQAKYGVDMNNQKMAINTKDSMVIIYLPSCKLLSLQLQLDKVNAISKTGIFNTITTDEYLAVQKQLYQECDNQLKNNITNLKLTEDNIRNILQKYYAPLQLKVQCVFGEVSAEKGNLIQ
jgi:Protein of unknown function (DUF4230)